VELIQERLFRLLVRLGGKLSLPPRFDRAPELPLPGLPSTFVSTGPIPFVCRLVTGSPLTELSYASRELLTAKCNMQQADPIGPRTLG